MAKEEQDSNYRRDNTPPKVFWDSGLTAAPALSVKVWRLLSDIVGGVVSNKVVGWGLR